ncbi:MAG: hypothetical protein WCA00_21685 [Candidatus Acidiferrales bacterium]
MPSEVMRTITTATKTIAAYFVLEALTTVLVAVVFSVPLRRLLLPFVLFLIPGIVIVPLILNARRHFDRPKKCAIWFACALSVFCFLVTIATTYSAIALGIWTHDAVEGIPFVAAFGCTIAAVSGYFVVFSRLTAKKP